MPKWGFLSLSIWPTESSPDSCWFPTPIALGCCIVTPYESMGNGDSQWTLNGTTVFMEVGFQLFSGRTISVVKYFHYHQGPSMVRCIASNLLPVIVKVPKRQMMCFSLETSALSKLLLWHCHVHSHFSSTGARGRVTGDSSAWSQPAFPSHSPRHSVTGRRATENVLDE